MSEITCSCCGSIIDGENFYEVEELHKQTDVHEIFAVFSKSENGQEKQYNVAYKEDDEKKIENIIGTQSRPRFRR